MAGACGNAESNPPVESLERNSSSREFTVTVPRSARKRITCCSFSFSLGLPSECACNSVPVRALRGEQIVFPFSYRLAGAPAIAAHLRTAVSAYQTADFYGSSSLLDHRRTRGSVSRGETFRTGETVSSGKRLRFPEMVLLPRRRFSTPFYAPLLRSRGNARLRRLESLLLVGSVSVSLAFSEAFTIRFY